MRRRITLLHAIPGRTRLKVQGMNDSPVEVEAWFRSFPFVYSAVYTIETGSMLLYHEPSISWQYILTYIGKRLTSEQTPVMEGNEPLKQHLSTVALGIGALILHKGFPSSISGSGLHHVFRIPSLLSLYAAREMIKNGLISVYQERRANADTLTVTAMVASIIKGNPSSAFLILIMSTLSELLTEYTTKRTRRYVRDMLSLDVSYVWKVEESGNVLKVPVDHVHIGDCLAVFEGEKISVDGYVVAGVGTVDDSPITGEFIPKDVYPHQYVYAGSIVRSGQIRVKVERAGNETTINRIVHLIEEAQSKQAPIQSFADRISEKLVPLSFSMAVCVYIFTRDWDRVLNMLVIDFVCGLKLSTATAISASIGKAAKTGVLVKGGQHIEQLAKVNTAILDKTGTITEGRPIVTQVLACNGYTEEEVIRYGASVEEHSSHPIAEAIIKRAKQGRLVIPEYEYETLHNYVGRGIGAVIHGKVALVGNLNFMEEQGVNLTALYAVDEDMEAGSVVYVAHDGMLAGLIYIEDTVRHGMKQTIWHLRQLGILEVVMLTGDKKQVAHKISKELTLDAYQAEVLPEEKSSFVEAYKRRNTSVMMVGDGINDAPALAHADVGVTMGAKRTDIAVEASDVIITSDDPRTLPNIISLSKMTMQTIRQNFFVTVLVNGAAVIFGATGLISPVTGAFIHNAATIAVVLNSAKILVVGRNRDGG